METISKSNNQSSGIRNNDPVINDFLNLLLEKLGGSVVQVVLFGSRARKDNKVHSDYDFLIVVDKKNAEQKDKVLDICVEIMDKYNALVGYLLYDKQEWNSKKNFPLGLNILKEGIFFNESG